MHPQTRTRLRLEPLEDRRLLSTCTVTRLADNGIGRGFRGDFRYCLTKANTDPGEDLIIFSSKAQGTINLTGALPEIKDDLIIAGPGADKVTLRRDTGGDYRIFKVLAGVNAQIYSVTMANGRGSCFNFKDCFGGGVFNSGTLTLGSVAVVDNHAISANFLVHGGGILNEGVLTIYDSTIARNKAQGVGGAFGGGIGSIGNAVLTMKNSTISENSAASHNLTNSLCLQGGGINNQLDALTNISNSTVTKNALVILSGSTFCVYGGGINNVETIQNTIVSGNTSQSCPDTCDTYGGKNLIGGDAKLGPLQDNGGPTETHALLAGSPAIDAGDNIDAPEWDQRGPGFPRVVNGTIDIGSFEVQATGSPLPNLAVLVTANLKELEAEELT